MTFRSGLAPSLSLNLLAGNLRAYYSWPQKDFTPAAVPLSMHLSCLSALVSSELLLFHPTQMVKLTPTKMGKVSYMHLKLLSVSEYG